MNKEELNAYFTPATTLRKLAGQYIVWAENQHSYYANGSGQSQETKYRCELVSKKQGDTLITNKFSRVKTHNAYVISLELAALWPAWDGDDSVLGNKKITKGELIELCEMLHK